MKKWLAIILSLCVLLGALSLTAYTVNLTPEITIEEFTEQLGKMNRKYKDEPVSNRLIVKSKHDIPILDGVDIVEGYDDLHIVQFDNSVSAKKALVYYQKYNLIEYAEEDRIASIMDNEVAQPQAEKFGNHLSWGSEEIGIDDYVDYLGDTTELPEIVVGIIDTGIEINHEFLSGRIIQTGYNSSYSGETNSENDDNGHGTHVAGIVVDNTTDNVKIKGYKVLDKDGAGSLSNVLLAIEKATQDEVDIINMSLGARAESNLMTEAVNQAKKNGIVVCVSAGNSGSNVSRFIPASIPACITVAAIGLNDGRPYWTNFGQGVDIIAPGVSINSSYLENTYKSLSGTSMASPFAAAACAMILTKDISYRPDDVLSILLENGRNFSPHYNNDGRFDGKLVLYIGTLTASLYDRTLKPNFSIESGKYSDSIEIEITCDEDADIYYTLDGTRATLTNGIPYTGPIVIDSVTRVHAIAKAANKLKSLQAVVDYYITSTDPDSNFEIDTNGTIVAYHGTNNYLTIPNTINGITVKAIGNQVFSTSPVSTTITMIKAPNTLESVGAQAFYGCSALYSFDCQSLKEVKEYAFAECGELEKLDLTPLETVERYAFWNCKSLQELSNEHITKVEKYAFNGLSNVINIYLPNVKRVEYGGLQLASSAQEIYIPKVEYLGRSALFGCRSVQELDLPVLEEMDSSGYQFLGLSCLKELSLPSLEGKFPKMAIASSRIEKLILPKAVQLDETALKSASHLEIVYIPSVTTIKKNAFNNANDYIVFMPSVTTVNYNRIQNATIYMTEAATTLSGLTATDCIVVAPSGSDAESWANENSHSFIDSDIMVDAIGTHTDKNGNTVFEFGWKNIDELEQLASKITYYGDGTTVGATIGRPPKNDGVTYFQVSGENELRGCVNIDGMVFRSKALTTGENELEPENGCEHDWQIVYTVSVPNDTVVVFRCDECDSYYRISFMEHINTDFPLLDMNDDNIVNAKDLANIVKQNCEL